MRRPVRHGKIHQARAGHLFFLAGSLADLLPADSIARTIWAGLEALDSRVYDALYKNDGAGRSALNPRSLAAVWILAILRGVTSPVCLASLYGRRPRFIR